jgi:acyl-coenzyme A thioesterase PaaI-like protein
VHGGVLLCGAEMAAAAADPRAELVTSSIRICYLRAVPAADDLEFVTREIRRGRTQSVIAVEVRDARGKPAVTSTVMRETRDRQGGNHGRLDLA